MCLVNIKGLFFFFKYIIKKISKLTNGSFLSLCKLKGMSGGLVRMCGQAKLGTAHLAEETPDYYPLFTKLYNILKFNGCIVCMYVYARSTRTP